jgi:hypothetical protein
MDRPSEGIRGTIAENTLGKPGPTRGWKATSGIRDNSTINPMRDRRSCRVGLSEIAKFFVTQILTSINPIL